MPVVDALAEIFTWTGFGGALVAAFVATVLLLLDGTWLPVEGFVEDGPNGRTVRWIDVDGIVHAVVLRPEQEREVGDSDVVHAFARRGYRDQLRLRRTAPGVKAATLLAVILGGVGLAAGILSIVLLFVRG